MSKAPHFTQGYDATFERLSAKAVAEQLADAGNAGDPLALRWLERLSARRKSQLAQELADAIPGISLAITAAVERGKLVWRYAYQPLETPAQIRDQLPPEVRDDVDALPLRVLYAVAMARVVHEGLLPRLRRCQFEKCHGGKRRWFVGDPRAQWCSPSCGSAARQRKWRERQRKKR